MAQYRANSLADIAQFFREMGSRAQVRAGHTTGTEKKLLMREGAIWDQAARMLEDTEIVSDAIHELHKSEFGA